MLSTNPDHRYILRTRVDATSYPDACDRIEAWVTQGLSCYLVAANVYLVMSGYWNQAYQNIINELPNRSKLRGITSLRLSHFVVRLHSTAPVRKLFLQIAASCGVCIPQN